MKSFLYALLVCLLWINGATESIGRVFTSLEGKEITAELAGVSGNEVELVVSGRKYTVPLDSLSAADQEYVREWAKANKTYAFIYLADAIQDLSKRNVIREKMSKTEFTTWNYRSRITSRTRENLENLVVKYNVVIRRTKDDDGHKNESSRIDSGTVEIPSLNGGDPLSFATVPNELSSKEWEVPKTVFINKDGQRTPVTVLAEHSDIYTLDGIWIRIFLDERVIEEWKSEGKMIKEVHWSETSTAAEEDTQ